MYLYKSLFPEIVLYLIVVCLFEVCIDGIVGGLQDENREGQIQYSDGQHVADVIPEDDSREENSELLLHAHLRHHRYSTNQFQAGQTHSVCQYFS